MNDSQHSSTVNAVATLHELTIEAGRCATIRQLHFHLVNATIRHTGYDRAVLWSLSRRRPRVLAVSGSMDVTDHSPLVDEWRGVLRALPTFDESTLVESSQLKYPQDKWASLAARTGGLALAWIPIRCRERTVAGLWLERWGDNRFTLDDLQAIRRLGDAYSLVWRGVVGEPSRFIRALRMRRVAAILAVASVLSFVLGYVHVPLRVVARCEVVAKTPIAVTAPLNGVLDEVPVLPGRPVQAGDVLAVYDKRVAIEELEVSRRQVQIVQSELERARVEAFDDPASRMSIGLLENRLAQERIRLQLAQERAAQLEVTAPAAGTLILDDPHAWRGRPVQVGERLMMIADPTSTKLQINLPLSDNIEFDDKRRVTVVLDSDPRWTRAATLRFVANESRVDELGPAYFPAEADWVDPVQDAKIGLQGTAVLYGRSVRLGYWLLRRPLAAIRAFCGI